MNLKHVTEQRFSYKPHNYTIRDREKSVNTDGEQSKDISSGPDKSDSTNQTENAATLKPLIASFRKEV